MRLGMSLAMIAVFVIALTMPEAYADMSGGLDGPLVLAIAYVAVRVIHGVLYLIAAGDDIALRRQVVTTEAVAMVPAATALIVGAVVGGPAQTWIWLGAFLYDFVLTYLSSRGGGQWRINAPGHWAERHGLVVILALGESIVAIGVGVAREPIDGSIIVGATLALTVSILLWMFYFVRIASAGERELTRRTDAARVVLGMNAYTYLHLAIIGGVILTALGVEDAMAHIGSTEPYGWFAASVLGAGIGVYVGATAAFARMIGLPLPWARVAAAGVLVCGIPLLAVVPPLWALALVLVVLALAITVESAVGRRPRR
ncbi:MAG TPA: low temperature requirement protein A, partial [Microbacterium sp.]|uniref:low temperature requirement protein A n=1 Tax=Microbacterium sp. TaxID=51671 RepID=UPI002CDB0469